MNFEDLIKADALRTKAIQADTRVAVELLRPSIAKAALEAKRRQKLRRERRLFLMALIPFVVVVALAADAALKGHCEQARLFAMALGAVSALTLLTLPILEQFLPGRHHG